MKFRSKPKREFTHKELAGGKPLEMDEYRAVTAAYCPNGHSLLSDLATFQGFNGITVSLRTPTQTGQLSLSPIVGDLSRAFFNFDRVEGEIVELVCPTCNEPLPFYDQCTCGAYLAALFTTERKEFSSCIGICQRIGCLHAKIISNYNLRKFSRLGYY